MGVCVFRVAWIYTVFAHYHELKVLYASYPISWIITALTHFICYLFLYKKLRRQWAAQN
jgi:Na+-driven multidrug efflux pump